MNGPTLVVDGLAKRYGPVRALAGVSFSVDAGEVFGYLGPNGAGKTTTLRIILGLVHASAGRVTVFGGAADFRTRREIGYLPGEMRLYGEMTGRRLLDYFAGFRNAGPPALRAELLAALGLGPSDLARRVKFLSHGTRQKIGLVIAMQNDPRLLLLDEPTTGLDPLVQKAFRDLVLRFAARGRAVFFSSHVLSEVEAVCTRVAILRAGELVAVESVDDLRTRMLRRLEVRFRADVPPDLGTVEGVARSEIEGRNATLWVRGDVNPVLRRVAREEVERFVFPEAELEDIFLAYYKGGR
ncbi:MAG TPA: ABC transporter ATP-binding protein [Acidobacteriota bacterium]|nr:ABC transporter ATP-binding protein [Acidobacteriota bacterium]